MGLYELRVTIYDPADEPDEAYEALLAAVAALYPVHEDNGLTDLAGSGENA